MVLPLSKGGGWIMEFDHVLACFCSSLFFQVLEFRISPSSGIFRALPFLSETNAAYCCGALHRLINNEGHVNQDPLLARFPAGKVISSGSIFPPCQNRG